MLPCVASNGPVPSPRPNTAATAADKICQIMGARYCAVNAFIGGMLHDLGQLIFIENFTVQYRKVYQQAKATNQDLHQVEKTVFGTTTAEVSSFLLELWGMTEAAKAVAYHHEPWQCPHKEFNCLDAVYVANNFTRRQNPPDQLMTAPLNVDYLKEIRAGMLARTHNVPAKESEQEPAEAVAG